MKINARITAYLIAVWCACGVLFGAGAAAIVTTVGCIPGNVVKPDLFVSVAPRFAIGYGLGGLVTGVLLAAISGGPG